MNACLRLILCAATLVVYSTLPFAQGLPPNVPLPPNLQIAKPADDLPADVKAFSGKWVGSWDGVLDHVLVVEEISSLDRVVVVYAYGTAPNWNIHKPGFFRPLGKIAPGKLVLNLRNGVIVTYNLSSPNEISGTYERQQSLDRITMKRVKE